MWAAGEGQDSGCGAGSRPPSDLRVREHMEVSEPWVPEKEEGEKEEEKQLGPEAEMGQGGPGPWAFCWSPRDFGGLYPVAAHPVHHEKRRLWGWRSVNIQIKSHTESGHSRAPGALLPHLATLGFFWSGGAPAGSPRAVTPSPAGAVAGITHVSSPECLTSTVFT